MPQRKKIASFLILGGLVSAGPAFGASGNFTFVIGDVKLQRKDGTSVEVTRGTAVNPGDAIQTGARGMAQIKMVDEAKQHGIYHVPMTCPGLGEIRTAQLLSTVVTPYRFGSKRSFWSYCGLAIVMRSSSDWVQTRTSRRRGV